MPAIILSDNGATSGSAGLKTSGGNDGVLQLQTTTSGGTPTTAISISNTQVVTYTNQPTYTGGTANGVLYLNGSKAVTSGTALVFDGTNLGVGVTSPLTRLHLMSSASSVTMSLSPSSSNTNIGYITNDGTYLSLGSAYNSTGVKFRVALQAPDNAATIDTSGNLGLGVTPSAWTVGKTLQISSANGPFFYGAGQQGIWGVNAYYGSGGWTYGGTGYATYYEQSSNGVHNWRIAASGTAGNAISFTQAMTLDANGSLLVNSTAPGAVDGGAPQISLASAVSSSQWTARIVSRNSANSTASFLGNYKTGGGATVAGVFAHNAALTAWGTLYINTIDGTSANGGNTVVGDNFLLGTTTIAQTLSTNHFFTLRNTSGTPWGVGPTSSYGNFYVTNAGVGVYLSNGGTSWTSYSDERKKDIIEPIQNAANKVSMLRAVIGKYKTDAAGTRRPFLIAQDVQAVLPEAVNTQGDDDDTLGLQYTDVIPLLVAAIKELKAEIDVLKGQA